MHEAIRSILDRYKCVSRDDYVNALREILQDLALLGLWRSKFFEHAAFYGGTALRLLHGLDRYSEDLDFSLLEPDASFSLGAYGDALQREIGSFGFQVEFKGRQKKSASAIDSAFLKVRNVDAGRVRVNDGQRPMLSLEFLRGGDFQSARRSLLGPTARHGGAETAPE